MSRIPLIALAIVFVSSATSAQVTSPTQTPTLPAQTPASFLPASAPTLAWPASSNALATNTLKLPSATPTLIWPPSSAFLNSAAAQSGQPARPCDGCPPRRVGHALIQATMINVLYGLGNLARGEETAKVTPETWWHNMSQGWEWDLNDFVVNQFGHPYQGNNYYTAGRANGMNYWESSALAAFGSATWEFYGETNDASLNDFVNTTLGGIALGEMFHRTAWLIRDTHATGKGRLFQEIGAMAIDPLTGYNRFVSGDASRVSEMPPDMVPTQLGTVGSAGVLWHKTESGSLDDSTASPFVELDLLYGDLKGGRTRDPYDAFGVRLAFGGGAPITEARVRGRLIGQPLNDGGIQMTVSQGYQYNNNDAYRFGAQSVDLNFGVVKQISSRVSMWALGWGGATVLGAVDSVPPPGSVIEPEPASEEEGEPTSRNYDYGPGTNAGGFVNFLWGPRQFLTASYELHHIHVIDGVRGNHLLQRFRADLDVPLKGPLGIGVSGDLFIRHTFYQDQSIPSAKSHFPQVRVFVSWSVP